MIDRVADALDTRTPLHAPAEQRMVHRDVQPANVLLEPGPGEHVYLVDFGVARTVAKGASITGVGSVVGTPSYLAPELWEGPPRRPAHRRLPLAVGRHAGWWGRRAEWVSRFRTIPAAGERRATS